MSRPAQRPAGETSLNCPLGGRKEALARAASQRRGSGGGPEATVEAAPAPPRWQELAGQVTSHCCYADVGGRPARWFRIIGEYAYMRPVPKVESKLMGIMQRGGLLHAFQNEVHDENGHAWVELTPLMKWRLHLNAEQTSHVYTLIDGTDWGAGMLLDELQEDEWPRPDFAERFGLRWMVLDDHAFRPRDARGRVNPDAAKDKFLCHWDHDPPRDAALLERSPGRALARWAERDAAPSSRLGACCMLRGAPAACVRSWLLYHLRIGFHCLYLFFDDPDDPSLHAAKEVATLVQLPRAVHIRACSQAWWAQQRLRSRFYRYRHLKWAAPVVDANECIGDVQSRQQLCVDLAIQDALQDRINWLVHIDIDELLYFPQWRHRENAPAWFASVEPHVDLIKFHNHECVPEDMEVGDWFRDVTLFKPAVRFLVWPDDPFPPPEVTPPPSEDDKAQSDEDKDDEEGSSKRPPRGNAFDEVLKTIAFARSRHTKQLELNLPEPPRRRRARARAAARRRRLGPGAAAEPDDDAGLPETFTHFLAYANGKCAVRLRALQDRRGAPVVDSLPLPCGVHSFMGGVVDGDKGPVPRLRRVRMDGDSDPGVLHYANCGFSYWIKKYEILGRFPDIVNRKQNTMRAHLAARDLVLRHDRHDMALYYRMFVMSNLIGELPLLFSRGLVVRVDGARQVMERAHREWEAAREG
eukprot:CAMPEP_0175493026 /NCGR_PEP_ID=MMETSP0096-20121207/2562_1 /TAXON_ID=311494 /ORGANISM="Alexandrium monilatum, Strain CCMP3105" /LENGTH=695 /DNA_ID=CAMNT_0016794961 /DNA_START=10 /DNA_END=2093 /DNA_ORIENTATION=-